MLLVLTLVAGASAGVVATVVLDASLDEYASSLLSGRRPATPGDGTPRSTPGSYNEALSRVKESGAPSLAIITAASLDSRLSGSWIGRENALGYGVVVSTDGWVLVHEDIFAKTANVLRGTEIWVDGVRYTPTQYVPDSLTEFALVKIAANNLVPVAFGAAEDVQTGEAVFVLRAQDDVLATTVESVSAGGEAVVLAAEMFDGVWSLVAMGDVSAPVFSSNGDLYGMTGSNAVVPMHQGVSFVREVMRSGAPLHAAVGAMVVEVSRPLNLDEEMHQGQERGALVTSVVAGGPGAVAGLAVGDVITAVDDVRVDATTSLAEILRLYDPGQSARFDVARASGETTLTVTFGDYDDLVY